MQLVNLYISLFIEQTLASFEKASIVIYLHSFVSKILRKFKQNSFACKLLWPLWQNPAFCEMLKKLFTFLLLVLLLMILRLYLTLWFHRKAVIIKKNCVCCCERCDCSVCLQLSNKRGVCKYFPSTIYNGDFIWEEL